MGCNKRIDVSKLLLIVGASSVGNISQRDVHSTHTSEMFTLKLKIISVSLVEDVLRELHPSENMLILMEVCELEQNTLIPKRSAGCLSKVMFYSMVR